MPHACTLQKQPAIQIFALATVWSCTLWLYDAPQSDVTLEPPFNGIAAAAEVDAEQLDKLQMSGCGLQLTRKGVAHFATKLQLAATWVRCFRRLMLSTFNAISEHHPAIYVISRMPVRNINPSAFNAISPTAAVFGTSTAQPDRYVFLCLQLSTCRDHWPHEFASADAL